MKALRIFLKVLLSPISLLLTVIVIVTVFLVDRFIVILNILSSIMFLAALAGFLSYLFGWPIAAAGEASYLQLALFGLLFSFVLSPCGLPSLAAWLLVKLDDLNDAIKSI